jgi:hypothetical protein
MKEIKKTEQGEGYKYNVREFIGLTTDTKPSTSAPYNLGETNTGSTYLEIDATLLTSYMYVWYINAWYRI